MTTVGSSSRLAVIGLDGATFRVLDPLFNAAVMPALKRLTQAGYTGTLMSTIPTYTPPAWVSMATGVNPGRHGIYGFLSTTAQEKPQIAHSGLIDAAPMWVYFKEMGLRSGIFNLPMSYPPMELEGFMVSGGLAAGWTNPLMPNFASSVQIGKRVTEISKGAYPLDTVVSYENDWRSPAVVSRIEAVQCLRRQVLSSLLEEQDIDVLFAVFEGPDRLQHLHYQYIVECSDWYSHPDAIEVRERAFSYFAELDQAIADIIDWAGQDGHVIVVSDHGFGPWEKTLNVNLLLNDWGYLQLPALGRAMRLGPIAGRGQSAVRKMLPRRLLHAAKARVGRQIAWSKTRAFASHVAEQGIHINSVGEMPNGIVDSGRVLTLAGEITTRLLELADPDDGETVVDRVVAREEVISGPHLARSPHLFPFLRDQRFELSDTLVATSPFTDHRDRPWGYHHIDGVFIGAGPNFAAGERGGSLEIVDILPTVVHLLDRPVPEGLDGRVALDVLSGEAADRAITTKAIYHDHASSEDYPFSPQEEKTIEDSLRGLGYLE